jgi:cell division protein FtsB
MVRLKKIFMRVLLLLEMVAFGHIYFFGNNGIKTLQHQRNGVAELQKNVAMLNDEINQLEKEIYVWQTDDFYKEKIAREQLQMARKGDELFYIGA